ncbi:MAG: ribose-5-phosphate isomerase RpiA [Hadesarchaea archaeon]|nr:ribose-5-phosphate isomerase RpiA [Hadesarchaea archaeon]
MQVEMWKRAAAEEAARLVRDKMVVGLGSGTTVAEVIRAIAKLRPQATFVPSSSATQRLASDLGLKLSSLNIHHKLDLMLDGADEVDPNFDMIKGRGGAHTREKIVAGAAKRVVIIIDRSKLVQKLGERSPVPVEVLAFAHEYTMRKLAELGGESRLRMAASGAPFVTDDGNYIVDTTFRSILKPAELEQKINRVPGVVENGIFVGVADEVFVGYEGGCVRLESKRDFLKFTHGKV